jgi:hypothetical protein
MEKQNLSKKKSQGSVTKAGSGSSAGRKEAMNQRDSTEEKHGKGGTTRKSNKESEDQDANQKGFGEDE